ncbi:FecR family protein, partial [Microbulbifer sp.]|uniref:FecR family protein n=1 Tax=Microbulbifer sp. TaxID=1908541 RepID=UPI003F2B9E4B
MNENRDQAYSSVATEAADWYARLRATDTSEMDMARFRTWLAGDPARRREFEAIDALWGDLKCIEASPEVRRIRGEIAARRRKIARPRIGARLASAAILLLAVVVGGVFSWQHREANHYATDVGEQRTLPLPDGSVVLLNTDSAIRIHYTADRRSIELVRGQVNFKVVKDPARPFTVIASGGEVRALGTVFDVYESDNSVTVTLIEGKVAVAATTQSSAEPPAAKDRILLSAGEQLSYSAGVVSVERRNADLPRATAWHERKLDFADTPLSDAIAEANRYSRDQVVLDAPRL